MLTWQEFSDVRPDLAEAGRALLYQFDIGLAFLATVRRDGGPRLHPVCPLIHDGHLLVFVVGNSPKRYDLQRDGRYALHTFPPSDNDDEFYCTGSAVSVSEPALRQAMAEQAKHDVQDHEILFELRLERALHTTWENPRQPNTRPIHMKWWVGNK
ncbi:pyridoxamine 5'-phosphate oxidase family protein [Candidatus Entotheonella palauensis]|uniref:pyridoxamine 5'-phosphate oxidase family protein n=1 Tax=Candidatus Entotheonella palauensis TaxID=93172 RepID=UPI0015C4A0E3|nr:pyridoxamine 5'-phosphate oxidase family protein [Candidatus Entotheonella palauensis]